MKNHQIQSQLKDEDYIRIWQIEQEYTRTRWTITTFFLGISFATFGFSFQPGLSPLAPTILRIVGLLIYWFAYILFLQLYEYNIFLRTHLLRIEELGQTQLKLHSGRSKRTRTIYLLLIFGLFYIIGTVLLWFIKT